MISSETHTDVQVDADLERYTLMLEAFEKHSELIASWGASNPGAGYGAGAVAQNRLTALDVSCKTLLIWH